MLGPGRRGVKRRGNEGQLSVVGTENSADGRGRGRDEADAAGGAGCNGNQHGEDGRKRINEKSGCMHACILLIRSKMKSPGGRE